MEISSRHHLRSDAVRDLEAALADTLGVDLDGDSYELVELEDSPFDLVLVDGEPLAGYVETEAGRQPFLTVRGANHHEPERGVVTVDAGAVSFVSDGADVMRPGITEADPGIEAGDVVVVVEETHGKALAVGRARVDGTEMEGEEGKVVDSLHHVGDELFEFDV
ncbi:MAG: RNA-binding protein [Halobacteriaceae archaeon]